MVTMWPEIRPAGSFVEGRSGTHKTGFTGGSVASLVALDADGQHRNGMATF